MSELVQHVRPAPRRASSIIVIMVRVVLAVAAFTGVGFAVASGGVELIDFAYWSQISAFLVGIAATLGVLDAVRSSSLATESARWLGIVRGATTSWTAVTLIIFATLLGGDYTSPASALEHLIVPVLAIGEWCWLAARRVQWWWPLAWVLVPLAYLPVYLAASAVHGPLYSFFRPGTPSFGVWFAALLVLFVICGYLVWLIVVVRGRVVAVARRSAR